VSGTEEMVDAEEVKIDVVVPIKVRDLSSEFDLLDTYVISELKKIGVWVASPDTTVDQDIANRIRRRLQLQVEHQQEEEMRAKKAKEKKSKKAPSKPRKARKKTIRQMGKAKPRKSSVMSVEDAATSILVGDTGSLKPRKGKAYYRGLTDRETSLPVDLTEVSIDDEPIIEKVEASVTAEILEKALASDEIKEALGGAEAPSPEQLGALKAEVEAIQAAQKAAREETKEQESKLDTLVKATLTGPPRELDIIESPEPIPVESDEAIDVLDTEDSGATSAVASVEATEEQTPVEITLPENVTVRELSERMGVKSKDILSQLISRGVMAANINLTLDKKVVEEVCLALNFIPNFVSFEESIVEEQLHEEKPEDLQPRAPIVTVMGHVDHGKTSLLDAIRKTRVAAGEAGGITQHIGAYHVESGGQKIVFIDTPGHAAFTRMRARGAEVTDIVVLVVAADDGVMPQTKEAIDHAREADVPIVVAINKVDKSDSDPQRAKQQLAEHQLIAEDWGGDAVMVEVSAIQGTNLDTLLEMILLSSEMRELNANPNRSASGVVLEARLDKGRGAVASLLVQNGTLRVGDPFIAGMSMGKIRAMFDDNGQSIGEAGPSSAIEILGLNGVPLAGDLFQVLENSGRAKQIVEQRRQQEKERERVQLSKVNLDDLYAQMEAGQIKELAVVVKADTQGSAEVLVDSISELGNEKVKIRAVHSGVGAISESDVLLAATSKGIVVGFNVRPEQNAKVMAEKEGVDLRLHTVIYELTQEIEKALVGLLEPTFTEVQDGTAEVRDIFKVPKFGVIAGCYVQEGSIRRNSDARLLRDHVVIYEGKIESLRRFKDDATEVKTGYECGISLSNFNDVKPGDVIEVFSQKEVSGQL